MKPEKVLAMVGIGLCAAIILGAIANDRKLSPNVRLIARTAEGDVVQDLTTGLFHLLV